MVRDQTSQKCQAGHKRSSARFARMHIMSLVTRYRPAAAVSRFYSLSNPSRHACAHPERRSDGVPQRLLLCRSVLRVALSGSQIFSQSTQTKSRTSIPSRSNAHHVERLTRTGSASAALSVNHTTACMAYYSKLSSGEQ